MADSPLLTAVIPTVDGIGVLRRSLAALAAQRPAPCPIIVVDNGSSDGTADMLRAEHPDVTVIRFTENRGFAAAVNAGIRASRTDYILLLNNDTEVEPGFLSALQAACLNAPPGTAAFNPLVLDLAGERVENAGIRLTNRWRAHHILAGTDPALAPSALFEIFGANAGASAYSRAFLESSCLFDEDFFAYYEDVDLAIRGRLKGWRFFCVPGARVRHHHSHTGNRTPALKRFLLRRNYLWYCIKSMPRAELIPMAIGLLLKDAGNVLHFLKTAEGRREGLGNLKAWLSLPANALALSKKRSAARHGTPADLKPWVDRPVNGLQAENRKS